MENEVQTNATAAGEQTAGNEQGEQNQQNERTFTQVDVNRIVQERLVKERERLSKVFQDERQNSELDERERAITIRELKADVLEKLDAAGLPRSLSGLINYENAEACENSLREVSTIFRGSLHEVLKVKARQETPVEGVSGYTKPDALRSAFGIDK